MKNEIIQLKNNRKTKPNLQVYNKLIKIKISKI